MNQKPYYVVLMGREPGIYRTWEDVRKQIDGFFGASVAKKQTLEEAQELFCSNQRFSSQNEVKQTKQLSSDKLHLLNVYVDGSYKEDYGVYSYGFAVVKNGQIVYHQSGANRDEAVTKMLGGSAAAELRATMEAVRYALQQQVKRVLIYYDFVGIMRLANGEKEVMNEYEQKYYEYMCAARKRMHIDFTKVKAHKDNYLNNFVDEISKKARICLETEIEKERNEKKQHKKESRKKAKAKNKTKPITKWQNTFAEYNEKLIQYQQELAWYGHFLMEMKSLVKRGKVPTPKQQKYINIGLEKLNQLSNGG